MSFGEAIKSVFSKYANFKGRASRSEFWYFVLFSFIITTIIYIIALILGRPSLLFSSNAPAGFKLTGWAVFISGRLVPAGFPIESLPSIKYLDLVCFLILFLPGLAVFVRRLHDIGRNGWGVLLLVLLTLLIIFGVFMAEIAPTILFYNPNHAILSKYSHFIRHYHGTIQNVTMVLSLVTIILSLVFFILLVKDGEEKNNQWGPNPKGIQNDNATETDHN